MIFLSPIDSRIRKELHYRIELQSRSNSRVKTINNTRVKNDAGKIDDPSKYFRKTPWLRVFSTLKLENSDNFTNLNLMGGELSNAGKLKSGFKEMYNQPQTSDTGIISPYRPLPGVKNISCEYKGGLKAIRTATVDWSCWSWDDLDRLKPYLMQVGRFISLEWGWSETFDGNFITTEVIRNNRIQEHILEQGGNYDAMYGIITNFSWRMREDGGFDCTTDVVSKGVDILSVPVSRDATTKMKSQITDSSEELQQPALTLTEVIEDLGEYLNRYSVNNDGNDVGVIKESYGFGPYITWGWMEDNLLSKFLGSVSNGNEKIETQFRSVDIVSNPDYNEDDSSTTQNVGPVQSNSFYDFMLRNFKSSKTILQSIKISNHKQLLTTNASKFILVGQCPITEMPQKSKIKNFVSNNINPKSSYLNFKVKDDVSQGYLRNILLHWNLVKESFSGATTVEDGLKTLFSELNNEVGGIWDFKIVVEETGNIKVIDASNSKPGFSPKRLNEDISKLNENYVRGSNESETKNEVTGKLFIFPVWRSDSIVRDLSMESKYPSSMAISAMYGSNSNIELPSTIDFNASVIAQQESGTSVDESKINLVPAWTFPKFGNHHSNPSENENLEPLDLTSGPLIEFNPTTVEQIESIESSVNEKLDGNLFNSILEKYSFDIATGSADVYLYNKDGVMLNDNSHPYQDAMKYIISQNPDTAVQFQDDKSIIIPIDLEITINGIGGIFPGNIFSISELPNIYKDRTIFQVMSVIQSVDSTGWVTTIRGIMRMTVSKNSQEQVLFDSLRDKDGNIKISEDELYEILKKRGFNKAISDDAEFKKWAIKFGIFTGKTMPQFLKKWSRYPDVL